jgi:ribosomal protein S11
LTNLASIKVEIAAPEKGREAAWLHLQPCLKVRECLDRTAEPLQSLRADDVRACGGARP